MSQVSIRTTASIIGAVTFLRGNDGVVVSPNGGGVIDVLGKDNLFTFNSAANTLTVELLSQSVGTTTTTDATPKTVPGVIVSPSGSVDTARNLEYNIIAAVPAANTLFVGTASIGAIRQNPAAPSLIGTLFNNFNENAAGDPNVQVIINGNDIEFQVIGTLGATIYWRVILNENTLTLP